MGDFLQIIRGGLTDVGRLFFPPVCPACGDIMPSGIGFICARCRWEIPLTGFQKRIDNPVVRKFYGHLPVVNACSFFYFVHRSGFRDLVHRMKYHGQWKLARKMGVWFGSELASSGLYADVDLVIPVPLHFRRRLSRGYNQSEHIALGIARAMGLVCDSGSVIRSRYNRSQAGRHNSERWENVEGIFSVRRAESLAGRHILLVDDVLTSGATIISCADAILRAVPDCRLSIATLSVSRASLK